MFALNQAHRFVDTNLLVESHIVDVNAPVMVTFSPAGFVLSSKEVEDGKSAWGYSFLKKMNINVISFNAINERHWFITPEVKAYIKTLSPFLEQFPERLGYGASMGAFAASLYANELNLDRLLLITPMCLPSYIKSDTVFNYANDFDGKITLIYDPFCSVDKQCAFMFPKTTRYLKFYSVGHQVVESLSHIGYLKILVQRFIADNIDETEFSINARKRKHLERYYSYLKRNPTKKNTKKRKRIIFYRFFIWNIKNPEATVKKMILKWRKSIKKHF